VEVEVEWGVGVDVFDHIADLDARLLRRRSGDDRDHVSESRILTDDHSGSVRQRLVRLIQYQSNKSLPDTTGMVIGQYSGFAYVIAVVPGSPAEKAGIKIGDVIEYVDTHAPLDLDLY